MLEAFGQCRKREDLWLRKIEGCQESLSTEGDLLGEMSGEDG